MALATYTFLPWLRRGIGNRIETPAGAGASRALLQVTVTAASDQASTELPAVSVQLVGPGDITGLQANQVIRTEPRANVTDFEWNYLAAIDFYDEDFPWRYSPAAPDGAAHRLAPWVTLVVLKDAEFSRNNSPAQPLPSFVLTAAAHRADIFPVVGQEWAWAHVQFNQALNGSGNVPDLAQLNSLLGSNPDLAYSRVLCPRKLDPGTRYTAMLIPTFEVGRKAGLGNTVNDADDGSLRAWAAGATEFPIYYEWTFRTGVDGDFESLVRALVPRDMDPRVGIRDLDIAHPGFGVDAVSNPPANLVGLEGALLAPSTVRRGLDASSDFQPQVETVLNAPADAQDAGSGDPLVAPPIYGCWPAQVNRVSPAPADAGWVNSLNLDPRYRAAAGLGGAVIRANQEKYMRTAWDQIGDVLTVNRGIRRAQLAVKAAVALYAKSTSGLSPEALVTFAAPVFSKVLGSPRTLSALVKSSRVPRVAISPAWKKHLRPRGRLARALLPAASLQAGASQVLAGINDSSLTAAPARPPAGGVTLGGVNAASAGVPNENPALANRWWYWLALLALVIPLCFWLLWLGVAVLIAGTVAIALSPKPFAPASGSPATPATLLSPAQLTPVAIQKTPAQPAFVFAGAGTEGTLPASMAPAPVPPSVPGDSPDAADLRRALVDFQSALANHVTPAAPRVALDVAAVGQKALAALEPHQAFSRRFASLYRINGVDVLTYANQRYHDGAPGTGASVGALREVMNYPDIKDPMCVPLEAISSDYLVPNLQLVPNNTISLMLANQPFIESYLVGLNHEFARELLWREYPTDQQGSYFRQFWDVSNYVDTQGRDPQTLAEALKDIPPIHQWAGNSALGSHDQRAAGQTAARVVLVIRGDLLKRYPNTFIYAQKAKWGDGERANVLVLSDESGQLFATAPQDPSLRFPLYQARVDPDLTFIGFDLTLDEVRGDPRLDDTAAAHAAVGDNNLGWFFVLQEAVGEPRFGLDVAPPIAPEAIKWDNLAWPELDLGGGQAIDVAKPLTSQPAGMDAGVSWGANAADMAYILYQEPSLVGLHGRTMLKNLQPPP